MSRKWGPWITHDGKGCPVLGQLVQVETDTDYKVEYIAGSRGTACRSWNFENRGEFIMIIRYRVHKPKGIAILMKIAEDPHRELESV